MRDREWHRKFRSKQVVVHAVQWTGANVDEIIDFVATTGMLRRGFGAALNCLYIDTLEGEMRADKGDWIIRGLKGEYYPCKPDIFAAKYEAIAAFEREQPTAGEGCGCEWLVDNETQLGCMDRSACRYPQAAAELAQVRQECTQLNSALNQTLLDHQLGGGPPLLFETMIFGGAHDEYQQRYSTWEEAEAGHKAAVAMVEGQWGKSLEQKESRRVAFTELGDVRVSTVFLGLEMEALRSEKEQAFAATRGVRPTGRGKRAK